MLLQGYLIILKSLGDGFSVAIFQMVKSWYDMSSFIRGDAFRFFLDHPHKPKDTPQWNVAINEFYVPSPRKQWLTVYRGSKVMFWAQQRLLWQPSAITITNDVPHTPVMVHRHQWIVNKPEWSSTRIRDSRRASVMLLLDESPRWSPG